MTSVQGELRLVTDTPDEVSQVWIQAPKERLHGTGMVTTGRASEQVTNGVVSFNALPGAAVMVLLVNGIPSTTVKLLIPDKANATLRECIEAVGLADAGTLSELESLSLEVARVAAQIASADRLEVWASETASAAAEAQVSKDGANDAANRAEGHASNAEQAESNAKHSELYARQAETDARSEASRAATEADSVRGELQGFVDSVSNSASDAAGSAAEAKTAETNAGVHASNALSSAERAEFAAEETVQQVEGDFATRNYVDAAKWERGGAPTDITDINDLAVGSHGIPSTTIANNLGLPFTQGTLLISRINIGKTVIGIANKAGAQEHELWMTSISGGTTAPWTKVHPAESTDVFHGAPPSNVTSVAQLADGEWSIASTTVAERLGLPGTLGTLKVMPIVSGKTLMYVSQQAGTQANEMWISSISGGVVAPWTKVGSDSGGSAPGLKTVGVTLTAGSTLNGDAGRYRVLAQVTAPVTRWRVHFECRRMIYSTTRDFTLGTVQVGDHTNNGAITNVETLKTGNSTISGESEWVSKWIDRDLSEEVLIDFQATGSSLMTFQAPAFKLNGSTWQTSKNVPLAVWIEVETYQQTPVVALIGDSTGTGQGADRPVHESALHVAGRKHGFIPMNYGYPGSGLNTMADGDMHIYKRWEHLDKPDSVIVQAGSNNIHGGLSLAELQGHLQDVVAMARDKISPVVIGSTVKARYPDSGDHQATLNAYNSYVRNQPPGTRDYLDFYAAVSPSGTVDAADAADAAHLSTSGHQKLATAFDGITVARPAWVDTAKELDAKADITYVDQRVPITGTGSPEGNVAAPVGAIYTDTAATAGAIRWIKTSGTGSTGWRVEYGDTGWRDITGEKELDYVEGEFLVRRVGSQVYFSLKNFYSTRDTTYAKYLVRLPLGFRKVSNDRHVTLLVNGTATGDPSIIYYTDAFRLTWLRRGFNSTQWPTVDESQSGTMSYLTDDAWPTSLPGTPA